MALSDFLETMQFVVVEDEQPEAPVCATCGNAGFVLALTGYTDNGAPIKNAISCPDKACPAAAEQHKSRYQLLTQRSRMPAEYAALTFDAWDNLIANHRDYMTGKWDAYGAARAFVAARRDGFWFRLSDAAAAAGLPFDARFEAGDKNSIVFAGVNGVGKTSLAAAIVRALVDDEIPAMYARVADFLSAVKERFDRRDSYEFDFGDTDQQIIRTFQDAPVLVWDEFGVKQYTEWRRDTVEQVIRHRYSHQMPTIFTTNLTYEELASEACWDKQIGHAVHGMAHWFEMGGKELRRRTGAVVSR